MCIKIFKVFGVFITVLITVGLTLGIIRFLSGIEIIKGLATIEEGASICVNAAIVLSGSFPFMYVLTKVLSKPFKIVSKKTKELKTDEFMGLHGIPLLNFAYKSMFYIQAEPIVKFFYRNPTLSVSNVGAIDTVAFSLANNKPFSAFVAGAAKNKPCAVMTALSINGDLSVSICLRGNNKDEAILEKFFTEYENNIKSF
jgi:hypothetical protein